MVQQQSHDLRLRQSLTVAVTLSLVLLIAGVIALGVAIQQRTIIPPELDASLGGLRIVAYTTNLRDCWLTYLCSGTPQEYRVAWVFHEPDSVHETWHQILTMPLQREKGTG
jgi:hypothetical protein